MVYLVPRSLGLGSLPAQAWYGSSSILYQGLRFYSRNTSFGELLSGTDKEPGWIVDDERF
jgi:hypothetical protein